MEQSAYRSQASEALKARSCRNQFHCKGYRNRPLPTREKKLTRALAQGNVGCNAVPNVQRDSKIAIVVIPIG